MRFFEKLLAASLCLIALLCCVPAALAADGAQCPHCDDGSIIWKEWKDGDTTPTSGHYILVSETVTVSGSKSLKSGDLVIDLNGKTLQMNTATTSKMFLVNAGAKLVFMDSSNGNGTVIGNQISGNNAGIAQIYGGGLDIYGGTFRATEGSAAKNGGLFYVHDTAPVVNIYGGTFHGIKAANGGVIALAGSNSVLNISGGTFYPNTRCTAGDSIRIDCVNATVTISGEPVIYGGVEVNAVGSLFISGRPTIQKAEGGSGYGIKVPEGTIIMVDALEESAKIDITGTGVVAQGFASPVAAAEAAKSIFAADETGKVVKARGLELLLTENSTQTTFDCPHCDDENIAWTPWDGSTKPTSGHYYLEDNAEVTKNASYDSSSSEDIVLNLNGYTLSKKSAGRMFQLQGSSKLTIMDSSADKTGAVVSNNASSANHGMIAMAYGADTAVTVYGGNFYCGTVNSGTKNGGLLYASPGAVYISGGELWGTSAQNGGAVAAKNGTLEITGGIFHPGTASKAGDTVYAEGASNLTIGGTAVIEGGVYVEEISSFTVEGTPQIQKEIGGSAYSLKTVTMVTLGALGDGAKIGITSMPEQTVFTAELADHAAAQAAQKFFCSDDDYKIITAEGKALSYVACEDAPADSADKDQLNTLYTGTTVYHGEMHDHSDSGGRSDGHVTLDVWEEQMAQLKMDFAAIVDHHQASHMRLELWDNTIFIGGSEAQTKLTDMEPGKNILHFNMIFSQPEKLEEVLYQFYDYDQTTGFDYIDFPRATMEELAEAVKKAGGMFTHVHPKFDGYVQSDNPLDYWFGNDTGLEVWCSDKNRDMSDPANQAGYKLWTDLLALGKRVWATAGNDGHRNPSTKSLTTVYAEEKHADSLISHLRVGDSTCGNIGIRMSIGSAKTGAQTFFKEGDRLVLSVGDFHESLDASHTYRVDLFDDRGDVHRQMISSTEENWLAFDVDPTAKFYRAEVYDVTDRVRIAIGNPIWNSAYQEDEPILPDPEPVKCPHCDQLVEWTPWNGASAPKAGHYILEAETVEVDGIRTLSSGDVVIDLNGKTLLKTAKNRMFLVNNSAKLVILDSSAEKTGTVIGWQGSGGHAGIVQLKGGSMDIYGGTFKMTEDSAALRGGLFYSYKDTNTPVINIYGGTFYGNEADRGGVIAITTTKLNIAGGTFYAGSVRDGGAGGDTIHVDSASAVVTISGDPVIYGGIQIDNAASVTLSSKPVIRKAEGGSAYSIKLASGKLLTLDGLETGAQIGITAADGVFTAALADANAAKGFFTADNPEKAVVAEGDALAIADKPAYIRGDLDNDGVVSDADAMYLLRYTLFGDTRYPLNQSGDVDGDGTVSDADAMYLLRFTLFGDSRYPLH